MSFSVQRLYLFFLTTVDVVAFAIFCVVYVLKLLKLWTYCETLEPHVSVTASDVVARAIYTSCSWNGMRTGT